MQGSPEDGTILYSALDDGQLSVQAHAHERRPSSMSSHAASWYDLNELPDDQFCDDCVGKQIPDQCIPLLQSDTNTPGDLPHYKSTGFMSRRFSCCFCRLLSHMISPDILEGGEAGLSFSISRYQTGMKLVAAPFRTEGGSSLPTCGIIQVSEDQRRICSTVDVDYEAIKDLLADCEAGHDTPSSRIKEPLRAMEIILIDVLKNCVVAKNSRERYLALSYVWGKVTMFPLTSENRPRLEQPGGLQAIYNRVPQTILDAITFTRNLGERYLWIDVLCIVQDDHHTRAAQIRQMDIIYGSALLTIISYSPMNALQGLPGIRPGTMLPSMTQKVLGTRFETSFLNFRDKTSSMQASSKHLTRAWTFQEVLLSSRSIYFGYREIVFACAHSRLRGVVAGEDDSYGLGRVFGQDVFGGTWITKDPEVAMKTYTALLPDYTGKDVTEASDRLFAFAGCLSRLAPAIERFIQGLPMEMFARSLLWQPYRRKERVRTRNQHFASWSWAGWEGPHMLAWNAKDLEMDVIEISISSEESPEPLPLLDNDSCNLPASVYGHQPDLGVEIHFQARAVPASLFRAKGIGDFRYDLYTLRLHAADDRWCGVLDSMEPELFNGACKNGSPEIWDLVQMARSSRTDGYRSQYMGWKQYEYRKQCMAEVLLIQWSGNVAERVTCGKMHVDAFEAAGPQVKQIVLK